MSAPGVWRSAASLIVTAPGKGTTGALSAFMVQRSHTASFMPSAWAFPGGVAHTVDFDPLWARRFREMYGTDSTVAGRPELPKGAEQRPLVYRQCDNMIDVADDMWTPPEWALRLCALRELYEECGVLLLADEHNSVCVKGPDAIQKDFGHMPPPSAVRASPRSFAAAFAAADRLPAFWRLHEWSNWLTPKFHSEPKRFDTMFYAAALRRPFADYAVCDEELAAAGWHEPAEVLRAAHSGERRVAPPQLYELLRLCHLAEPAAVLAASAARLRKSGGFVRICPQMVQTRDGKRIALLNADSLYADGRDTAYGTDVGVTKTAFSGPEMQRRADTLHRVEFDTLDPAKAWSNFDVKISEGLRETLGFPDEIMFSSLR